jgi:hypothetical protein
LLNVIVAELNRSRVENFGINSTVALPRWNISSSSSMTASERSREGSRAFSSGEKFGETAPAPFNG